MLSRVTSSSLIARRWAAASSPSRWASTLVVAEPLDSNGATPGQTQSAVTAAAHFGQSVDLLVVGEIPPTQIPAGVATVYHVPIADRLAESAAAAIQAVATEKDCSIVLGTSTKYGSTVIPRVAGLLDVSPITDILEIKDESELEGCAFSLWLVAPCAIFFCFVSQPLLSSNSDTFVRPMYAGNVLCKVAIKDPTKRKVLSVRPTSFDKAPLEDAAAVETIDSITPFDKAEWVGENVSKSDRPDLQSAGTVVSGGRGIKVSIGNKYTLVTRMAPYCGLTL
jgi:electron transfer flavoprotein alpha subunit